MIITLSSDNLRQIFKTCAAATSSGQVRPTQAGIELTLSDGILTAAGCDGIRMHSIQMECKGDDCTMVIPKITMPRGKYDVTIEQTDDSITFTVDGKTEIHKRFANDFVNWREAIPQDEPIAEVLVNSTYMKEAFAAFGANKPVRIEIRGGAKPIMLVGKDNTTQALVLPLRKG